MYTLGDVTELFWHTVDWNTYLLFSTHYILYKNEVNILKRLKHESSFLIQDTNISNTNNEMKKILMVELLAF